jgi:hypothetical protein
LKQWERRSATVDVKGRKKERYRKEEIRERERIM